MDNELGIEYVRRPQELSIFQQEKANIDVQVATAKAYPRNIKRCVENAVTMVTMSKEIAESCTYALPRGKKPITGPSVALAKIIAQTWGNLRVSGKVVDIDLKHVTSEAVCWDLETNTAFQVQVKRLIMGREGRYSEDMITVTGNAANSISMRNAILSVVPKQVVDKIYNAAKNCITGDVSSENKLMVRRKQVIDGLKDTYGVTEKEILDSIGKASIDHITPDNLVVLIGIGTAIKDGDTTVDEAFRNKRAAVSNPTGDKKEERIMLLIKDAKTIEELEKHKKYATSPESSKFYDEKYAEIINKK